jgi:uncharacterized protein (AIM24 family)
MRAMKGAFKRMVAGMPIFLTEAQGPGEIAFPVTAQATSSLFT